MLPRIMHEIRGFHTHTDFEFNRRSKIISLAQGEASLKQISSAGGERLVIPHLVIDKKDGGDGRLGVALHLPQEGYLYRQMIFNYGPFPIATWRGMKVAERVGRVDVTTLDACLGLAQGKQHYEALKAIERDNLAVRVGGPDQMQALRQEVLDQSPTTQELQKILEGMVKYKSRIITGELKRELEEGRIEPTPLIAREIKKVEDTVKAYQEREAALKIPLPSDKGIVDLFRMLEVGNLITGGGFGAYGLDWGPISLEDFERDVRRAAQYGQNGRSIDRMTTIPKTTKISEQDRITASITETGEIENPSVTLRDGRKLTLTRAMFNGDGIVIKTKVEEPGKDTREIDLTTQQIRELF